MEPATSATVLELKSRYLSSLSFLCFYLLYLEPDIFASPMWNLEPLLGLT